MELTPAAAPSPDIDIIELAVAVELECAGLYEVFARAFQLHPQFSTFWKLYAEAERYHAATIRIHQATFDTAVLRSLPVETAPMRAFLDELRALRSQFERRAPSFSEALAVARKTEEASAELHGRTQFFRHHPQLSELFEKMAEEDQEHRDLLQEAEQRYAVAS